MISKEVFLCLTGDCTGKQNICPIKPYIRSHSQHSGKLPTKIKTPFFKKSNDMPKKHVEATNRGHEFLEGEKIQCFWHEHCEFCWEKALTDKSCTFYCTEDMYYWVCEECFQDFQSKFNWQVGTEEELLLNSER